jgi:plastocyanin
MRSLLLLAAVFGIGSFAHADEKYVTIKGTVKWNGEKAPELKAIEFNGNADKAVCCKEGPLMSNEVLVDPKSLGFQNVVVWLRTDNDDKESEFPPNQIHPDLAKPKSKEHIIDQPKCQFEPRITMARAGDTLVVKNSAKIGHNVKFLSLIEEFNNTIPSDAEVKLKKPLEAQRTPISVACSIHGWMTSQVRVFNHPYYALTDKDGKFEIKDAPVGKWRIVYQHENGFHQGKPDANQGYLGFPITLKGDKKVVELEPMKHVFLMKKKVDASK